MSDDSGNRIARPKVRIKTSIIQKTTESRLESRATIKIKTDAKIVRPIGNIIKPEKEGKEGKEGKDGNDGREGYSSNRMVKPIRMLNPPNKRII